MLIESISPPPPSTPRNHYGQSASIYDYDQGRSQEGGGARGARGAWGSAPNPGAAPRQERTTGGSAPDPAGAPPQTPAASPQERTAGGSAPRPPLGLRPSGGLGAGPPVVRSCGEAAPGFGAEPQAPRAPRAPPPSWLRP